jgi:AcrR family transcriptional regulator
MSPRSYTLGKRQAAVDQTRSRIIEAAHGLLATEDGPNNFTIDAVAHHADVSRMTVYYQFGSKQGLLEALFDEMRVRARGERLDGLLEQPDPKVALTEFIAAIARFFADSDRLAFRHLRAMAALDPDFAHVVRAREERGRKAYRDLVTRSGGLYGRPALEERDQVVDALMTLVRFETFDAMAGNARGFEDVVPLMQRLALVMLGTDRP